MGGTDASLSKKKTAQAHPLQMGGGSKIKSAVTVCSVDSCGHVLLELVSNTGICFWFWEDRAAWPPCGILPAELIDFYN